MTGGDFRAPDGCRLAYDVQGEGLPVLWQHGLGADRAQPAEVFPDLPGVRRITLECRGHGRSDLGDEAGLSIARFADDALALLDHLGVDEAVVGGISLGAAIALRLAALHPARVAGLVLARPAWVDEDGPERLAIYRDVAALLRDHGPDEGRRRLLDLPRYRAVAEASPDNAASMRWFFDRPRPDTTIALLDRIPLQGPGVPRDAIGRLGLPARVIANDQDYVHPLAAARTLAGLIPDAELRVVTSKTVDRERYVAEFRSALADFLRGRAA